jgi:hypothetical protein
MISSGTLDGRAVWPVMGKSKGARVYSVRTGWTGVILDMERLKSGGRVRNFFKILRDDGKEFYEEITMTNLEK